MKASPIHYIRRRARSAAHEGSFFRKDNTSEQGFFGVAEQDTFFQQAPGTVQRMCDDCEKENNQLQRKSGTKEEKKMPGLVPEKKLDEEKKKVQAKAESPEKKEEEKRLQRIPDRDDEKESKLHRHEKEKEKEDLQRKEGNTSGPSVGLTSTYINTLHGKGSALPNSTQSFFNTRMGYDFSNVKVHTGPDATASAKEVNAKAYAFENHIVFNEGQYDPSSQEGKKLLAHELVHTIQQEGSVISKKDDEVAEEECTAGSVDLEALTTVGYKKNAGSVVKEKTTKSKGCPSCEDECVNITGTLQVPYSATTKINLPPVPADLSPCQQARVKDAINGPLLAHEKAHVKAFEKFNGTASFPINFKGCQSDYTSFQEAMAEKEFERRKTSADAESALLDPFSVPVDLCCVDKVEK